MLQSLHGNLVKANGADLQRSRGDLGEAGETIEQQLPMRTDKQAGDEADGGGVEFKRKIRETQ